MATRFWSSRCKVACVSAVPNPTSTMRSRVQVTWSSQSFRIPSWKELAEILGLRRTRRPPAPRLPPKPWSPRPPRSPVVSLLSVSLVRTYRHLLVSKHAARDLNTFAHLKYRTTLRDPLREIAKLCAAKAKVLDDFN